LVYPKLGKNILLSIQNPIKIFEQINIFYILRISKQNTINLLLYMGKYILDLRISKENTINLLLYMDKYITFKKL